MFIGKIIKNDTRIIIYKALRTYSCIKREVLVSVSFSVSSNRGPQIQKLFVSDQTPCQPSGGEEVHCIQISTLAAKRNDQVQGHSLPRGGCCGATVTCFSKSLRPYYHHFPLQTPPHCQSRT